jgi:hypothetical protein
MQHFSMSFRPYCGDKSYGILTIVSRHATLNNSLHFSSQKQLSPSHESPAIEKRGKCGKILENCIYTPLIPLDGHETMNHYRN